MRCAGYLPCKGSGSVDLIPLYVELYSARAEWIFLSFIVGAVRLVHCWPAVSVGRALDVVSLDDFGLEFVVLDVTFCAIGLADDLDVTILGVFGGGFLSLSMDILPLKAGLVEAKNVEVSDSAGFCCCKETLPDFAGASYK